MTEHTSTLEEGGLDNFVQAIVGEVPPGSLDAGQAWVLGEALFNLDPRASRTATERAFLLAPNMREVSFSWAI